MKTYLKIGAVILFIVLCIGVGVKYGMDIHYKNELNAIYSSRDISLDNYRGNKALAESYLQVYEIVDENSYQNIKNDMYEKFSTSMRNEIFPTVNYTGIPLHTMKTEVIKIIGTNNVKGINTFLVEYNLKAINYDQNITNLIDIENGVITKVTRIK